MTFRAPPSFPQGSVVSLAGSASAVASASATARVLPGIAQPAIRTVMEKFDDGEGFTSVWIAFRGEETEWHGFFDIDSED